MLSVYCSIPIGISEYSISVRTPCAGPDRLARCRETSVSRHRVHVPNLSAYVGVSAKVCRDPQRAERGNEIASNGARQASSVPFSAASRTQSPSFKTKASRLFAAGSTSQRNGTRSRPYTARFSTRSNCRVLGDSTSQTQSGGQLGDHGGRCVQHVLIADRLSDLGLPWGHGLWPRCVRQAGTIARPPIVCRPPRSGPRFRQGIGGAARFCPNPSAGLWPGSTRHSVGAGRFNFKMPNAAWVVKTARR